MIAPLIAKRSVRQISSDGSFCLKTMQNQRDVGVFFSNGSVRLPVATVYGLNRFYWKLCFEPHPMIFWHWTFQTSCRQKSHTFAASKPSHFVNQPFVSALSFTSSGLRGTSSPAYTASQHCSSSASALIEPGDWLPLHGSPRAKCIRYVDPWANSGIGFFCRTYVSWGALFSRKVLGIRRHGALNQFVTNFTVFSLSGVAHALDTFSCGYLEDIVWLCLNFTALVAEEGVQWPIIRLSGRWNGTLGNIAGFLWVFAVFSGLCLKLSTLKYSVRLREIITQVLCI